MKKIYTITIALALLAFLACNKKPLPSNEPTNPMFYLNADMNGTPIYFGAGEEDYYMNSSFYYDTTSVYVLKADLKQNTCGTNCGYALTILVNDKKMSGSSESINMTNALHLGDYMYNDLDLEALYYQALLKPVRDETALGDHKWFFNGQQYISYTATTVVEAKTVFSPSLSYDDSQGSCNTTHFNVFKVGNRLQTTVSAIKVGSTSTLQYSFSTQSTGKEPYIYSWDFGDGSALDDRETPEHIYASQGPYNAALRIIDANKDTCISYYQVPAYFDLKCDANFTCTFVPLPNNKAYSTITVLLTDPNGKVYSSKDLIQPEASRFEVLSVEDYVMNEHNEPTKKMKVRFNCTLKNGSETITLNNAEAVLAVSYK